jgi:Fe-S-cluster containining protein
MAAELPHVLQSVIKDTVGHQQVMARHLLANAHLDGLGRLSEDKSLPARFIVNFQKAMALFDQSLRVCLGHLRHAGFLVRCKPSCAFCCHQMPTGVSGAELVYLYYGLQQRMTLSRLFRRCLEAEELWVEIHRRARGQGLPDGNRSDVTTAIAEVYCAMELPCPFLQNNRCLVYDYRPLACRMHFSLSSPAWCKPSHFQHPYAMSVNLQPGECVFDALERLENRLALNLSDVLMCGLLEMTVNVMQFEPIRLR